MQTIVMFCDQRWKSVAERPAQFVSHLAQDYHVVYVEEPIATASEERFLQATRVQDNVTIVVPHLSGHPPMGGDNDLSISATLIRRYLADNSVHEYLAWFFSTSSSGVLAGLSPLATIYDCSHDYSAHRVSQEDSRQRENLLLQRADLVITSGPSLGESMRAHHRNVICIPSGVDAIRFSPFSAAKLPDHVEYASNLHRGIGHPRLGFHGEIDDRLDFELIQALANANLSWHVVLSGPVKETVRSRLPHGPNIHFLGASPRRFLPHLVAQWAVCLLPYATNESTRFLNPSQALDYMAYGRAVVGTPLDDVRELYGDAIRIAGEPSSFIDACRACTRGRPSDKKRRDDAAAQVVRRSSWPAAMDILDGALEELRDARKTERSRHAVFHSPSEATRLVAGN